VIARTVREMQPDVEGLAGLDAGDLADQLRRERTGE
jgi:hypothetical protein